MLVYDYKLRKGGSMSRFARRRLQWEQLLILGAGGFGHMIQETAKILGYEEVVFLDDALLDQILLENVVIIKRFWKI